MVVTGTSKSRLYELEKYTISSNIFDRYFTSNGGNVDGVIINKSIPPNKMVYSIGGIEYTDLIENGVTNTTFKFTPSSNNNFENKPIYKDQNKNNIVSKPKINSDVFIARQQLSVFNNIYKLGEINNIIDLSTYASGKYFNIVKKS